MLSELGLKVTGSDYSAAMLEVAGKNLANIGKQIPLRQGDFRYLEQIFTETFDGIVCLNHRIAAFADRRRLSNIT